VPRSKARHPAPASTSRFEEHTPQAVSFLRIMFLFGCLAVAQASEPKSLDAALDAVGPGIKKWAAVCVVTSQADGKHSFTWHDYRNTADATDFWPASTIKLYPAIAALELINERGFATESATVTFERGRPDGKWTLDCSRTMTEMLSEVFRRSSNEDYTLLLRMVGIDGINTRFLTPERGFPHSALMRGYVLARPHVYKKEEPQRITLRDATGRNEVIEHTWSGHSYAQDRGVAVFDVKTGNLTSPRELGECLKRVLFHEELPEAERYRLTPEQLEYLRKGRDGFFGLETKGKDSGPIAWESGVEKVFPKARFFHKCGTIGSYALEVAYVDDSAESGKKFILVPAVQAGSDTKPVRGEKLIGEMALAIAEWVRTAPGGAATSNTQH
jgi:hypothetical protein